MELCERQNNGDTIGIKESLFGIENWFIELARASSENWFSIPPSTVKANYLYKLPNAFGAFFIWPMREPRVIRFATLRGDGRNGHLDSGSGVCPSRAADQVSTPFIHSGRSATVP